MFVMLHITHHAQRRNDDCSRFEARKVGRLMCNNNIIDYYDENINFITI